MSRGRTRTTKRRAWASVVLAAVLLQLPYGALAGTNDDAARRAAEEIQAARDRANQAADAMFEAESRLDTLSLFQLALGVGQFERQRVESGASIRTRS